jgi:enediyne biosynthesis protein E3
MSALFGSLRKLVFGIPTREISFERRGFRGGAGGMRERLEQIGQAFAWGYHAALQNDDMETLAARLKSFDLERQGFAFEGAAMGLALLDFITPWHKGRVRLFLQGAGDTQTYMVHVGAGWLLARRPGNVEQFLSQFDPTLRWLVVDGYGFHEGFFRWPRYLAGQPAPARLMGYAARAFDQGLGRCLWFIDGGDVSRIPQTIAALRPERHGDLWSGVGLACVYAGGVSSEELVKLRKAAGPFQPQLAQGAAFAAKARLRAGTATPHTELASGVLCGLSAKDAALVTDVMLKDLPPDGVEPAYEIWRRRIQQRFAS